LETSSTPRDAPAPFNKPSANIILRSVDGVDFRVREGILAEASSIFEDMLSLPPLPGGHRKRKDRDDQEYRGDIPVIPVTESSRTLENILRFCYPVENPKMMSAVAICEALEASKKYMMEQAEKDIKKQFANHADQEPLRLYAIAASHDWKDQMKIAAQGTLSDPFPVGTWVKQMEMIDARAYMRLQVYHKACSDAAGSVVLREIAMNSDYRLWHCSCISNADSVWFKCEQSGHRSLGTQQTRPSPSSKGRTHRHEQPIAEHIHIPTVEKGLPVSPWILDYLEALKAEVQERPRGQTISSSALTLQYTLVGSRCCLEPSCATRVAEDIVSLRQSLATAVDMAVSRVQLEV